MSWGRVMVVELSGTNTSTTNIQSASISDSNACIVIYQIRRISIVYTSLRYFLHERIASTLKRIVIPTDFKAYHEFSPQIKMEHIFSSEQILKYLHVQST